MAAGLTVQCEAPPAKLPSLSPFLMLGEREVHAPAHQEWGEIDSRGSGQKIFEEVFTRDLEKEEKTVDKEKKFDTNKDGEEKEKHNVNGLGTM